MTIAEDTDLEIGEETSEEEAVDIFDMPDDEFDKQDEGEGFEPTGLEEEETSGEEEEPTEDEEVEEEPTEEAEEEEVEGSEEVTDEDSEGTPLDEEEEDKEKEPGTDEDKDTSDDVDYKAAYESIMKPFKANGKLITPENPEDAVSLMQMGANYVKKMTTIKPALKVLSTLEKNNIDETELSFLIDVKNKNPEAIKKLIKDSNLNIHEEYDPDAEVNYTSSTSNLATEEEAMFNQAVREIQSSEHFGTTKKIITEVWDKRSREALLNNPQLLSGLHEEVELERFDKVQSIVDRERTFGRLTGMSDLEAYTAVVSSMAKEEATKQPEQTKAPTTDKTVKVTKPVNKTDKTKAKPSPTKASPSKVKYTDDDLLNMSDEAFQKLENKNLY